MVTRELEPQDEQYERATSSNLGKSNFHRGPWKKLVHKLKKNTLYKRNPG